MRLNNGVSDLVSIFVDWEGVLANFRGIRQGNSIVWSGYKPNMLDDPITLRDVASMAEERQYTYQVVEDGSLIQICYDFDDDGITVLSAKLAYYGNRDASTLGILVLPNIEEEVPPNSLNGWQSAVVPWLRVDFDPASSRGVLHSPCHMHLSGLPDSRLMLNRLPNPKQFVEYVLALFYPDTYSRHRLEQDGAFRDASTLERINAPLFPIPVHEACALMTHIYVPGQA